MDFTPAPMDSHSIHVTWNDSYPECALTVNILLDNKEMPENMNRSSYIITDLNPATTYNVCLVARDKHNAMGMHCKNVTTAGIVGPPNTNASDSGECVYYQLMMFAVDSY